MEVATPPMATATEQKIQIFESVSQPNETSDPRITYYATSQSHQPLMTPDKPDNGVNSRIAPPPTYKSILLPVIADLNKFHPTNYVSSHEPPFHHMLTHYSECPLQLATKPSCPFSIPVRRFCGYPPNYKLMMNFLNTPRSMMPQPRGELL